MENTKSDQIAPGVYLCVTYKLKNPSVDLDPKFAFYKKLFLPFKSSLNKQKAIYPVVGQCS